MKNRIQNIAPLLADDFVDFEPNSETKEKYSKLVMENSQRLGLYFKYLTLLHDSWFIETKLTEKLFSTKLNDFTTHVFADALISKKNLNITHDKLVFPIHIDFEIFDLSFNIVNNDGIIKEIEQTDIHEYLYEQIITIDKEKIELGLVVWKNVKSGPGKRILILLSAKNINMTEFQDKAWKSLFENKYNDYYDYFKSQLKIGRYLSDQSLCAELIDEYDKEKIKLK